MKIKTHTTTTIAIGVAVLLVGCTSAPPPQPTVGGEIDRFSVQTRSLSPSQEEKLRAAKKIYVVIPGDYWLDLFSHVDEKLTAAGFTVISTSLYARLPSYQPVLAFSFSNDATEGPFTGTMKFFVTNIGLLYEGRLDGVAKPASDTQSTFRSVERQDSLEITTTYNLPFLKDTKRGAAACRSLIAKEPVSNIDVLVKQKLMQ